jgi:elongation factor P
MAMITTADFSIGTRILIDNEPFEIVDMTVQSPTARGGNTLVKFKARNLLNGRLTSESVKAGTKFEEPEIRFAHVQYLYTEGEDAVFMDQETYEQFNIPLAALGEQARYLDPELKIKAMYFNEAPVNIELPQYVELEVTMVEPGSRGNTANSTVTTRAELSNGMEVQVPLNIKQGERVLINTTNHTYHQRA